MSEHEFDVVVVGMGPGGEYIATKLATAGLAVAAVEQNLVGGECPFWACNPTKMMVRSGNLTRSVDGKTVARHLRPGPELEKIRREVAEYERFRDLVGQVTEVNQGRIILSQLLGRPYHPAEYHAVPRVTFTDPEIGAVGLTEAQARDRLGGKVSTAVRQIPQSARGWIHKAGNDGFIKLVVDAERGVLVGATSAGPDGGEVLSMLTLAVHAGIPVQRLREMIYPYPTFHGAVPEAIGRLA